MGRYLLLEFPQLTQQGLHIVEIGCGCGSSLLPALKANPSCRVTATDISPTAVSMFQAAARQAGIEEQRLDAFVRDAALGPEPRLAGGGSSLGSSVVPAGKHLAPRVLRYSRCTQESRMLRTAKAPMKCWKPAQSALPCGKRHADRHLNDWRAYM